jgi:hypothetical protein
VQDLKERLRLQVGQPDITPEELKGRNQRSALERELDQRRRKRRNAPSAMTPRNRKTTAVFATGPLNRGSKPIAKGTKAISNRASVMNTSATLQKYARL